MSRSTWKKTLSENKFSESSFRFCRGYVGADLKKRAPFTKTLAAIVVEASEQKSKLFEGD